MSPSDPDNCLVTRKTDRNMQEDHHRVHRAVGERNAEISVRRPGLRLKRARGPERRTTLHAFPEWRVVLPERTMHLWTRLRDPINPLAFSDPRIRS